MSYQEEFITEEAGMVKYRRTEIIEPYGKVTVELYLTAAYLDSTHKNVIENGWVYEKVCLDELSNFLQC